MLETRFGGGLQPNRVLRPSRPARRIPFICDDRRGHGPLCRNLEMPFDQLDDFITPAELFYIRSHFPTPQLDPVTYRLAIAGAVRSELRLSYADIRAMPSRTCIATLECAGN